MGTTPQFQDFCKGTNVNHSLIRGLNRMLNLSPRTLMQTRLPANLLQQRIRIRLQGPKSLWNLATKRGYKMLVEMFLSGLKISQRTFRTYSRTKKPINVSRQPTNVLVRLGEMKRSLIQVSK